MNLKINVKNWKLRQYRDFTIAAKEGNFDTVLSSLASLIESWDLAGNPKDENYWLDELDLTQWRQIVEQVNTLLTETFNQKN